MKEFELSIRLRNNRLKQRRDALGATQDELAQAIGVNASVYQRLESLTPKTCAQDSEGNWTPTVLKIAEYYDVEPSELFPSSVLKATANTTTRALDGAEIEAMMSAHQLRASSDPERLLIDLESRTEKFAAVRDATLRLSPKETYVLSMSFGFDSEQGKGVKLADLGTVLNVSTSWVHHMRLRSLRKLRRLVAKKLKGNLR